jgi:hypothetical protein
MNTQDLDETLWLTLASEGKFDLMERLRKALLGEPGFGTIAVNREGFSENDRTHNLVIRWLKAHDIHVLDVMFEIGNLERAAASFLNKGEYTWQE